MLDFAPDAVVVVEAGGTVTYANRQVESLFGWPPADLVGQPIEALLPEGTRAGHVGLRDAFLAHPRTREMGAGQHLTARRRDGTSFPVEISLSPLPGEPREVMAAIRDVTVRRGVEDRAHAMLEFAPDATIIVDHTGAIVEANRQAAALFGHAPDMLLELRVEDLVPERHRARHGHLRSAFTEAPHVREMGAGDELSGLRADGSEFAVEISLSPLPGTERQVMATVRDVSDRRATAQALQNALEVERRATGELRRVTRLRDEFLDVAAHELRTPLALISGFASTLVAHWENQDDEARRGFVERIDHHAQRLTDLTEGLLNASRIQAGRAQVTLRTVDVAELLRGAITDLEQLTERDVRLETDEDVTIRTDAAAVSHVATNLLSNAAKYSTPPAPIEVAARAHEDGVTITVTDHGAGVLDEDLPHLFEHFYRGENRGLAKGSGVGLSVAKQYVELLDGRLEVTSTRGEGSTFTAWFPTAPED